MLELHHYRAVDIVTMVTFITGLRVRLPSSLPAEDVSRNSPSGHCRDAKVVQQQQRVAVILLQGKFDLKIYIALVF